MSAPKAEWTAAEWLAWLRRCPTDPVPHWKALNDCADALAKLLPPEAKP